MDLAINNTQPEERLNLTGGGKAILRRDTSGEVEEYVNELTAEANEAAASLFCGSILAGQSSETDEYGDVGVWLGDLEIGPAASKSDSEAIVEALSLTHWTEEVRILGISAETRLPVNIPPGSTIKRVGELLGQLTDTVGLTVKGGSGGPANPGTVIYVTVGRLGGAGWAGLVGVGISSDI
ncbi:hypothetical protein BDM02DRAFT_3108680, partial [Thelephora ganbajun]